MKKQQAVQFFLITIGLLLGAYFSKRNFALHQEASHGFSTISTNMDHGLLDVSQDSIIPSIDKLSLIHI